jgi:serine protease AprX
MFRRAIILLFVAVCLILGSVAMAEGKIAPELEKKIASLRDSNEKIPVVVLYEGMPLFADVAKEYRFLGAPEVIREQTIRVMKENAESLHYWLQQLCENASMAAHVEGFTSIWVVNAVALKADAYAIQAIANQPNIEKILLDEPVPMLLEGDAELTWGLQKINAPGAWQYYDGKGVTVAVIDTGVNEHTDLKVRIVDGKNYIDATKPPRDDHSHGTHCSGTVAGDGKKGLKTGVAPKATIMAVKVLSSSGSGAWSNLWLGIEEIIGSKATVISMSLGGFPDQTTRDRLRLACKNAIDAGIIPVIAAGNSGSGASTIAAPGDVPEVITVGATDSNDAIAYFSSRGPTKAWGTEGTFVKPDVSAPGVDVESCSHNSDTYTKMSGTSMATPHVAGLTALMLQAKPELTAAQVKQIMEQTATDLGAAGKDNTFGAGRINADKAVLAAQSFTQVGRSDRWETVVKELSFPATVDSNGNIEITQSINNDLMPATVTIWVQAKETAARKGYYHVSFTLTGPNGTKTGTVRVDYDNIPTDPNKYDAKYGFNAGNFELVKGDYTGTVKSIEPNPKVQNMNITIGGKATWPARTAK